MESRKLWTCLLNGKDNYQVWAYTIRNHFLSNGLDRYVFREVGESSCQEAGDENKDESKIKQEIDQKSDKDKAQEAKSLLISSIRESELINILHCEDAFQIWPHFERAYGKKTSNLKLELLNDMNSLTCEQASQVTDLINKAMTLKGRLIALGIGIDDLMAVLWTIWTLYATGSMIM